jgi:toxin ParE1/3/4
MTAARLSRRARGDVLSAARWIADNNPAAARSFRLTIERIATLIGERPGIGHAHPNWLARRIAFVA